MKRLPLILFLSAGSMAFAKLPNDRWSYDDPVTSGSPDWSQTGNSYTRGAATFDEWSRDVTITEQALNPAGRVVGTDRFDRTTSGLETISRNRNAGAPNNWAISTEYLCNNQAMFYCLIFLYNFFGTNWDSGFENLHSCVWG
jgi:hypothetical protein